MNENKELSTITDTTNQLLQLAAMPKSQIKREMDHNYLSMLVKANPSLDKQHFVEFITKCQLSGADPRLNQIYLIVHDTWNSQTQRKEPKGTTVFSYQFFIRLAQQTGQLEGFDVEIVENAYLDLMTGKKKPSLTARAWVQRKGQVKLHYKARLWEFAKTNKDGVLSGNWKSSPYLMLEKCAVANVMRWAFPEVLGNYYVADEMEKATAQTAPIEHEKYIHKEPETVTETIKIEETKYIEQQDTFQWENEVPIDQLTIEEYRTKAINLIESSDINFEDKIGKTRQYMLDKIKQEHDKIKVKNMYDFISRMIL